MIKLHLTVLLVFLLTWSSHLVSAQNSGKAKINAYGTSFNRTLLGQKALVSAQNSGNAEINAYGTSFNRTLLGQKALMDAFTIDENGVQDLDVFVPVWGRGVSLGLWEGEKAPKHTLYTEYLDAAGPRSVRLMSAAGFTTPMLPMADPNYVPYSPPVALTFSPATANNPVWATSPEHHANVSFARLCARGLGARGSTDIQCWQGFDLMYTFLQWMCGSPTETDFQPADVYTCTLLTPGDEHQMNAFEKAIADFDISFVMSAGNGPATLNDAGNPLVYGSAQSAYNAIAVGASPITFDGYPTSFITGYFTNDYGLVRGYGTPGRMKPDLVAVSHPQTSFLAPIVAGMSARLKEAATDQFGPDPVANQIEVHKAILLSGATKKIVFDTPHAVHGDVWDAWSRTPERPIDEKFGTGIANIAHSYDILSAGSQAAPAYGNVGDSFDLPPTVTAGERGWSGGTLGAGERAVIHLPKGKLKDFHFSLCWNLEVTELSGGTNVLAGGLGELEYRSDARLANLNLKLLSWVQGQATVVDESRSAIDNVEHLYQPLLGADAYSVVIENTSSFPADYGAAFRSFEANPPEIVIYSPSFRKALDTTFRLSGYIQDEHELATVETSMARIIDGNWFYYQADGSLGPDFHREPLPTFPWLMGLPAFNTTLTLPPAQAGEGIAIWSVRTTDIYGNVGITAGPVLE